MRSRNLGLRVGLTALAGGALATFIASAPMVAQAPSDMVREASLSVQIGTRGPHPAMIRPSDSDAVRYWSRATNASGKRIVVSLEDRYLWLLDGRDTLYSGTVAVGRGEDFSYEGKQFHFATPRGQHRVLLKKKDPIWTPPDWHYLEKAATKGLTPVFMQRDTVYELSDGTALDIRGDQVGRINQFGNWWPWTPGMEIIFDGKIFVPPLRTAQREVPNALGPYALSLGDGYLIHGTHIFNENSLGQAVSHGCIRMDNDAVTWLYNEVAVGTPVYIY